MNTCVKPLKCDGRVVIRVSDAGENEWTDRYLASVYGWHRHGEVGGGRTPEAAIRDLARNIQTTYDALKAECLFIGDEIELPAGCERAEWGASS